MNQIIFLEPVFKETIWGGDRIASNFNYNLSSNNIGEAWLISAHENGDCLVKDGEYKGQSLSSLWQDHRQLFGNMPGDTFPLLVKIIDAKSNLSIQVHPDDDYAYKYENGALGKTECWYIIDCDKDSNVIVGHNAKDNETLQEMIHNNKWEELIRQTPIKKGDFFQIEPGTVHAIKAGTLILEIQQNSDITYRLYDYDRLSNGKLRELHIDKSIDVITSPQEYLDQESETIKLENGQIDNLISSKYYKVRKIKIWDKLDLNDSELFTLINVLEGSGEIDGTPIHKGDNFILPNGYNEYSISGDLTIMQSCPLIH